MPNSTEVPVAAAAHPSATRAAPGPAAVTRTRRRPRRWQPAWLFMAPSLTILGVFVVWPVLVSFWYSLHDWTIGATEQPFVGLDNYVALTQDERFWGALVNTVQLTVVTVVVIVVVGLALALALSGEGLLTRVVRSAFFFPTVVSLTSIGLVWRFLLDPELGLVGGLLRAVGLPAVSWLQDPALALPTIMAVDVWKTAGFAMIVLLGGLKAVPVERIEAGRLDGCGTWDLVRHVLLPSIRPTMLFTVLILTIQSLQLFDLVYVMTGGGPLFSTDTLVTMVFREGITNFQTGYASAISWVLFALIMAVSLLQLRFFRYDDVD